MRNEIEIELISELCKDCPRLELETVALYRETQLHHRCRNLQFCREVLGFWKYKNRIGSLELTNVEEDYQKAKEIIESIPPLKFPSVDD